MPFPEHGALVHYGKEVSTCDVPLRTECNLGPRRGCVKRLGASSFFDCLQWLTEIRRLAEAKAMKHLATWSDQVAEIFICLRSVKRVLHRGIEQTPVRLYFCNVVANRLRALLAHSQQEIANYGVHWRTP